jgi:hypothetical protein
MLILFRWCYTHLFRGVLMFYYMFSLCLNSQLFLKLVFLLISSKDDNSDPDITSFHWHCWQVPEHGTSSIPCSSSLPNQLLVLAHFNHNPSIFPIVFPPQHILRRGCRGTLSTLNTFASFKSKVDWTASSITKCTVARRDSGAAKMCGVCGLERSHSFVLLCFHQLYLIVGDSSVNHS